MSDRLSLVKPHESFSTPNHRSKRGGTYKGNPKFLSQAIPAQQSEAFSERLKEAREADTDTSDPQGEAAYAERDENAGTQKPSWLKPNFDAIPEEMKNENRWVCWREETKPGAKKPTKVPVNPHSGRNASSTDPNTWGSFDAARKYYEANPKSIAGVGFVLGGGWCGVDFDRVVGRDGIMNPNALEDVKGLDSYAEISVSNTGAHVIAKGTVPRGIRVGSIELYPRGQYFTVSGKAVPDTSGRVEERQKELTELFKRLESSQKSKRNSKAAPGGCAAKPAESFTQKRRDHTIFCLMRLDKNWTKIKRLWNGDDSEYDDDASRGDMALMSSIAYYAGPDLDAIKRIFFKSKRGNRGKCRDRVRDYVERTIKKVLNGMKEFYDPTVRETDSTRLARLFLDSLGNGSGRYPFVSWNGNCYRYEEGRYSYLPLEAALCPHVHSFISQLFETHYQNNVVPRIVEENLRRKMDAEARGEEDFKAKPYPSRPNVTSGLVANVIGAIKAATIVDPSVELGSWLDDGRPRNLLSVQNGLLDIDALAEGKEDVLLPHSSWWFSLAKVDFDYDPQADCPRWRKALERNTGGDKELVDLIQEMFGYCLVHDTSQQCFFLCYGEANTGKSSVLAALHALLGDKNVSHAGLDSFSPQERHTLIDTLGKLVNITYDADINVRLSEGKFKSFVSGEPMEFNPKGLARYTAKPTARLIIAANAYPMFADSSEGLWRREILLPFHARIKPEEQVPGMNDAKWWIRQGEMSGILNWAIEGLIRLRRQGRFTESAASKAAMERHRFYVSSARAYIQSCCTYAEGSVAPAGELYRKYREWCRDNGIFGIASNPDFGKEMVKCFSHLAELRARSDRATIRRGSKGSQKTYYPDILLHADGIPEPEEPEEPEAAE